MAKRGYRTASEYASQAAARIQINDSGFIDIVSFFVNTQTLKVKRIRLSTKTRNCVTKLSIWALVASSWR